MKQPSQDFGTVPRLRPPRGIARELRTHLTTLRELTQTTRSITDHASRRVLAHEIQQAWRAHSAAVDHCVYWLLSPHTRTREAVRLARAEHALISSRIRDLLWDYGRDPQWFEAAERVLAAVDEHIENEELGVLCHLPLLIDPDDSTALAQLYVSLRDGDGTTGYLATPGPGE